MKYYSISPKGMAGLAALTQKQPIISDVSNAAALQRIHTELRFAGAVDKSTVFRRKQMIISPIMVDNALLGVLEVINNKNGQPFTQLQTEASSRLCKTVATALQRPK